MCQKSATRYLISVLLAAATFGLATASPVVARPVAHASTLTAGPSAVEADASSDSLETAASRATDTGRTIASSLIGLALAVAAVVLVFRRDFKEAIGLLVVGVIAVLLVSPLGLSVLQETVSTLFGSS
jgi:membrane-bound metal-dependent hydrolase YbcI (DUF457 family)